MWHLELWLKVCCRPHCRLHFAVQMPGGSVTLQASLHQADMAVGAHRIAEDKRVILRLSILTCVLEAHEMPKWRCKNEGDLGPWRHDTLFKCAWTTTLVHYCRDQKCMWAVNGFTHDWMSLGMESTRQQLAILFELSLRWPVRVNNCPCQFPAKFPIDQWVAYRGLLGWRARVLFAIYDLTFKAPEKQAPELQNSRGIDPLIQIFRRKCFIRCS
jgi:hypothetical protein